MVAIEYVGATVSATAGSLRRPLLEHAFDTATGRLAAPASHHPRIGFMSPERGWPEPPQVARCPMCTSTVAAVIGQIVDTSVERAANDVTIWIDAVDDSCAVWLYPDAPH